MSNNVFIKSAAIIESCDSFLQLEVAFKYVSNAGLKSHINYSEWDLLYGQCCKKLKSIGSGYHA